MIRPLLALTRQVQEFFHAHLIGHYRWDDVEFRPRERIVRPSPETWARNKRGKRIRPDTIDGKHHNAIELSFGLWDLLVEGPDEHPPLGWIRLGGLDAHEGPLDPSTWNEIAERIKQSDLEREHGDKQCGS